MIGYTPNKLAGSVPFRRFYRTLTEPITQGAWQTLARRAFKQKGAVTKMSADMILTCRDCGQAFTFTSGEQDFYASRWFQRTEPLRRLPRPAQGQPR